MNNVSPDRLVQYTKDIKHGLTNIRTILETLGFRPKKEGSAYKISCPWHNEKTPSCSIRVGPNQTIAVKCHGCGQSGTIIDLIAVAYGLNTRGPEYLEILRIGADLAGLHSISYDLDSQNKRTPYKPKIKPITQPTQVDAKTTSPIDSTLFDRMASIILERSPLMKHEDVRLYLENRKLLDLAHEAGWGALPPPKEQGLLLEELVDLFGEQSVKNSGFVYVDEKTDKPNLKQFVFSENRILIPYFAPGISGLITTIQRRMIRDPRPGSRETKLVFPRKRRPPDPYLLPCDLENEQGTEGIAFCEGAQDTLALRWISRMEKHDLLCLGVPGIENWLPDWVSYSIGQTVYLALDLDAAGKRKTEEIRKSLYQAKAINLWWPEGATGSTKRDWCDALKEVKQ